MSDSRAPRRRACEIKQKLLQQYLRALRRHDSARRKVLDGRIKGLARTEISSLQRLAAGAARRAEARRADYAAHIERHGC